MRLVVSRTSARLVLRWTQYSLLAGALSVFCYTGFVLADTWIFQVRENRHLDSLLHNVRAATNRTPLAAVGGLIGRITIPRLGVSVIIAEGVNNITLRRAARTRSWNGTTGACWKHRNLRTPRYVLSPAAEHPPRRHHHAHHLIR